MSTAVNWDDVVESVVLDETKCPYKTLVYTHLMKGLSRNGVLAHAYNDNLVLLINRKKHELLLRILSDGDIALLEMQEGAYNGTHAKDLIYKCKLDDLADPNTTELMWRATAKHLKLYRR